MSNIDTSNSRNKDNTALSSLLVPKSLLWIARVSESFLISKFIRGEKNRISKILTVLEIIN